MWALDDRVASPSEIAEEVSAPLGNVSYHVRFLERVGLLELVEARPRRGAVEHYYRARGRARATREAWGQMPVIAHDATLGATLHAVLDYVGAAVSLGGFEHRDALAERRPLTLDSLGFGELAAALQRLVERAGEIEAGSARRLVSTNRRSVAVDAGLVLMLFAAPPPPLGLTTPQQRLHRGSARRRTR